MPLVLLIVVFLQNSLTWLLKTLRPVRIRPLALPGKLCLAPASMAFRSPHKITNNRKSRFLYLRHSLWDCLFWPHFYTFSSRLGCFVLCAPALLAGITPLTLSFESGTVQSNMVATSHIWLLCTWNGASSTWRRAVVQNTHQISKTFNKKTKNVKYLINNSLHDSIIEMITFLIYWGKGATLLNLISFGSF